MKDIILLSRKKIVLTGGGTAGHVYPALAINERLENFEVHYIGGSGMEKDIISKEKDIIYHKIDAVKLERKLTLKNFLIPFKLFSSIKECKKILKEISPSVVFSKGGFVALPVVIAAKKLNIPIISHESDLTMGLANKIIFHFCDYMCVTFKETCTDNKKFVYTGQPIRKKVLNGNKKNLKFLNRLSKAKPNLLIIGGSSGAKFLNNQVSKYLDKLLEKYNVIHLTGKGKKEDLIKENYVQEEYADNIGDYLDLADIVVSRAGSGAINEFLALNKPMLLIPLSKSCSRGDQIENAKNFTSLGYSLMIEEEEFNEKVFFEKLDNLLKNSEKYVKNMKKASKINASDKIIKLIKKIER